MTVEYTSTRREIAAWYWHSLRTNPRLRRRWALSVLLAGAFSFGLLRFAGSLSAAQSLRGAALCVIWVVLVFALYPQLMFKPQKRALTIGPRGIETTIGRQSGSVPWSEIASIETWGTSLCLRGTSLNAFVIPSRAFSTVVEKERFEARCLELHQAALEAPAN